MAAKKPAASESRIKVLDVKMGRAKITILGTGEGLVVHRFGSKARKQIDKTGRLKLPKNPPVVPEEEFYDACYVIDKKNPADRFRGGDGVGWLLGSPNPLELPLR